MQTRGWVLTNYTDTAYEHTLKFHHRRQLWKLVRPDMGPLCTMGDADLLRLIPEEDMTAPPREDERTELRGLDRSRTSSISFSSSVSVPTTPLLLPLPLSLTTSSCPRRCPRPSWWVGEWEDMEERRLPFCQIYSMSSTKLTTSSRFPAIRSQDNLDIRWRPSFKSRILCRRLWKEENEDCTKFKKLVLQWKTQHTYRNLT